MAPEDDTGISKSKKVAAAAALGVAIPAAVTVAKKVIGGAGGSEGDEPDGRRAKSESRERSRESRKTAASAKSRRTVRARRPAAKKAASSKSRATSGSTPPSGGRTREQLYRQAVRLKIKGRSNMNKSQLERAVDRVRGRS